MPLALTLKPGDRLTINGAVISMTQQGAGCRVYVHEGTAETLVNRRGDVVWPPAGPPKDYAET